MQSEFSRGDVAGTRNRLGHPPASFPRPVDLERALDGALAGIGHLARLGLVPTIYRQRLQTSDASGRQVRTFSDGSGLDLALYGPSETGMAGMPPAAHQLVIVPGAVLRDTAQPMCLLVLEDTDFAKEWSDYRDLESSESHAAD
jgi:hypothetical protein